MQASLKLMAAKGFALTSTRQSVLAASQLKSTQVSTLYAYPQRSFAPPKKGKKGKKKADNGEASEGETTDAGEEVSTGAAVQEDISQDLYKNFDLGNVKVIESTPDNKPPSKEDTIEGRYASVLFTAASTEAGLYKVFEDMKYFHEIYQCSETFRNFVKNPGFGNKELDALLTSVPDIHPVTIRFLTILSDNKRMKFIKLVAEKYIKLYGQFNKEEKITIISAKDLSESEKQEVLSALQENPNNQGKEFQLEFKVEASIQGGLQMYTESEFMDMSLQSRMDYINTEIGKMLTQ